MKIVQELGQAPLQQNVQTLKLQRESSERSQWSSDDELPEGVRSATDLALHRNRGNRQPLNDSPSPPRSPPKLQREKSLDSFPSMSETPSERIKSDIKQLQMKKD
ncbi:hypothetical protein EAE96_002178 [Botrytis aclada]|nr:hypothetical protein EAE96_002178 [Botrytis aclada]